MSHRYRLYPTPDQELIMTRHCADARFVWNLALEQFNLYQIGRPTPDRSERQRQLAEARKSTWLGEGSSPVQQVALRDFDQAVWNWRRGTHRRPGWRKKGVNEGFCIRDVVVCKLNDRWATVHVPKCGPVKFRLSRPMSSDSGMGRVTIDRSGRWHVSFASPQPKVERQSSGRSVGLDRGVAITVATSDGEDLHCPVPSVGERRRVARFRRKMARQVPGSKRRERTRQAIAKLMCHQANRRKDWMEKVSTRLVIDNDVIVMEDLDVRHLMKSARGTAESPGVQVAQKRGLNRSIGEQGWTMLARRIGDKAQASGVIVVKIPPAYTSRTCSTCGYQSAENRTSQAEFRCQGCGYTANADFNAAINIRAAGLAVLARGGVDSSRACESRTLRKDRCNAA